MEVLADGGTPAAVPETGGGGQTADAGEPPPGADSAAAEEAEEEGEAEGDDDGPAPFDSGSDRDFAGPNLQLAEAAEDGEL